MFLRQRKNPTNRMFFEKMQQQISKAPGFKALLSYEDFLKIMEANDQANKIEASTEKPETVNV